MDTIKTNESPNLFVLLFLLLAVQLCLLLNGTIPVFQGELSDPDSYMRMNRVVHLYETGNWYDSTYPRSNAPYGEVLHWTRPLDAILLTGALLAQPLGSFRSALHGWGILVSPILHVLALLAIIWLGRPFFDRDRLVLLGGLFVFQPAVTPFFLAGVVDHHGLLLLCFVLLLGCTVRLLTQPFSPQMAYLTGVIGAFALWISPESLVGIGSMSFHP